MPKKSVPTQTVGTRRPTLVKKTLPQEAGVQEENAPFLSSTRFESQVEASWAKTMAKVKDRNEQERQMVARFLKS